MTEIAKNQCYYPHCACEHEMCEFATQAELNREEKNNIEQMAEAFVYATPHWNDGKGNAAEKEVAPVAKPDDEIAELRAALHSMTLSRDMWKASAERKAAAYERAKKQNHEPATSIDEMTPTKEVIRRLTEEDPTFALNELAIKKIAEQSYEIYARKQIERIVQRHRNAFLNRKNLRLEKAYKQINQLTEALTFYCCPVAYEQTNVPMDDVRHPSQIAKKAIMSSGDAQIVKPF